MDETGDGPPRGEPADAEPAETAGAIEPTRAAQVPESVDHEKLPVAQLPSSAPSKPARGLAFGSIVVGGLCGGLIGYAFTDLQCDDGCAAWAGLGAVIGALVGAIGVAIVAVLVLRAMTEWETVKEAEPTKHPSRRRPS